MQPGQLVVITGPSGVGKGTLVRHLLTRYPNLSLSVSATTRPPRPGEIEGKDYYFVDRTSFEGKIGAGQFLEWAEYAGNYYGTPQLAIANQLAAGHTVILEIELQGARQISQTFPQATRIFIQPPSFEELERRLRGRGKDDDTAIARRLDCAQTELAASTEFDYQIVNDDLETALSEIEKIIFSESHQPLSANDEGNEKTSQ
jgi:guanylate kinase